MVVTQLVARNVRDQRVLSAMRVIERQHFVPPRLQAYAYIDRPLPIGHGQTISQPYIVAFMSESLRLTGKEKVLEIGTGSGYQAAVLAKLAKQVFTIEIVAPLGQAAKRLLATRGYTNVSVRVGDGYKGWPSEAPFDAIMVTAAPKEIPKLLLTQLKVGGVMVIPVGDRLQYLLRIVRTKAGYQKTRLLPVRFVPMTGTPR